MPPPQPRPDVLGPVRRSAVSLRAPVVLAVAVVVVALLSGATTSRATVPTVAAAMTPVTPVTPRTSAPTVPEVVDGVILHHLPAPLGSSGDFRYEFDDVRFVSRVWESHRPDGGWRVDLDVETLRGEPLSDATALRDWFVDYDERDPQPAYTPIAIHGRPGWRCADQILWLVRPGVAVVITLDGSRWPPAEVLHTARATDVTALGATGTGAG